MDDAERVTGTNERVAVNLNPKPHPTPPRPNEMVTGTHERVAVFFEFEGHPWRAETLHLQQTRVHMAL